MRVVVGVALFNILITLGAGQGGVLPGRTQEGGGGRRGAPNHFVSPWGQQQGVVHLGGGGQPLWVCLVGLCVQVVRYWLGVA